jgi:predicted DNA-binding protein
MAAPEKQMTIQLAFRLPDSLVARVDAYAKRLNATTPGLDVTRTDAVRALLTQALDRVEAKGKSR